MTSPFSQSQPYATDVQLAASVPAASELSAELLPVDVWGGDDTGNTSCPMVKDAQEPPLVDPLSFSPATTAVGPGQFTASLSVDPTATGSYLFCAYAEDQLIESDAVTVAAPPATLNVASTPTPAGFIITASGTTPLPSELLITPIGDCIPEWAPACTSDAVDAATPIVLPAGPFSVTFPTSLTSAQSVLAQLAPLGGGAPYGTQFLYLALGTQAPSGVTVPVPTPAAAPQTPPSASQAPTPAALPTARLSLVAERVATARRRGIRADVMCDGQCALRVVLRVRDVRRRGRLAAGTHELGSLTVTLSRAGTSDVLIRLSASGEQLLRGADTAQVTATATLSAPGVPTTNRLVAPSVTLGH